jgi:hypothetical protein
LAFFVSGSGKLRARYISGIAAKIRGGNRQSVHWLCPHATELKHTPLTR